MLAAKPTKSVRMKWTTGILWTVKYRSKMSRNGNHERKPVKHARRNKTNLGFHDDWPDVTLPHHSPAFTIGFEMLNPKESGVYGDRAWKQIASGKPST